MPMYALDQMEIYLHEKFIGAIVHNYGKYNVFLYFIPRVIIFLHVVPFSHVLYLEYQKLKVKTDISLCMAMLDHPRQSLYTRTTILCENCICLI